MTEHEHEPSSLQLDQLHTDLSIRVSISHLRKMSSYGFGFVFTSKSSISTIYLCQCKYRTNIYRKFEAIPISAAWINQLKLRFQQEPAIAITVMPQDEKQQPVKKTLGEAFDELAKSVPQSAWDSLPKDLSSNVDHYLYGTPKAESR